MLKRKLISTALVCLISFGILFSFPVAAETTLPDEVLFSSCATELGWNILSGGSNNNGLLMLDGDDYTTAPGSIKIDVESEELTLKFTPTAPIDIAENNILAFDIYVDSLSSISSASGKLWLSSAGEKGQASVNWGFSEIESQISAEGWNSISLNIADSSSVEGSEGEIDTSAINLFEFEVDGLKPSKSAVIGIDNIHFVSTAGNTEIEETYYTEGYGVAVSDEVIDFGDVSIDGSILASDALLTLQYAVGKVYLLNDQMTNADVDGNGKINASDALLVLQCAVGKIDGFGRDNVIEQNDYMSQINRPGNRLITPYYGADKSIVAVADVIYFGAIGDGEADDTAAFKAALVYAQKQGGGVVFVPVGTYKITSAITIPDGVTLRGDAPDIPEIGKPQGTIIHSYVGMGSETAPSLFNIRAGSGVKNMSIYYPEQTMDNIQPCSYTVKQVDQYGPTVESILFINSYNAVTFGPAVNALQTLRNCAGTALKNGYYIDYNVDICRVENVHFSPEYWIQSGLGVTDEENLRDFVKYNCNAFIVERVDWTYMTDIYADGAYVGLRTGLSSNGTPNGQMFNFAFKDCIYGCYFDNVNVIGKMFTNGTIEADVPIYAPDTFTSSCTFNNVEFITTSGNAVILKNGKFTFTDCDFIKDAGPQKDLIVTGGNSAVALTNCTFDISKDDNVVFTVPTSNIEAINCLTKETFKINGDPTRVKLYYGDYETETIESDTYDYERDVRTKPLGNAFADLSSVDYGLVSGKKSDAAGIVQQAIDDVYELGGGVVYVPAGVYYLLTPITVRTGVELQGSCNTSHHSHVPTTMFYTDWGKEKPYDYTALITLESQSGVQGFNVMYTDQHVTTLDDTGLIKYNYTIRGAGYNTWVVNILLTNSYYGVDMFTNRCDGHYVEGLTGTPLMTGIKSGGGSANAIVRDTQFNVHYYGDNPIYSLGHDIAKQSEQSRRTVESLIIGDTVNIIHYNNFMLGAKAGLVIEESPKNAFVLAHGSDGANYSCYIRGSEDKDVDFLNSQFVCVGGYSMEYLYVEDGTNGDFLFVSTNFWGTPHNATYQGGGDVRFYSGTLLQCGTNGMQVYDGSLVKAGVISKQTNVTYDIVAGENSESVLSFGNLYANEPKTLAVGADVKGTDFSEDSLITENPEVVVLNNCESLTGWSINAPSKLDKTSKTQGDSSVSMEFDLKNNSLLSVAFTLGESVNSGLNDQFTFDIYVEDPEIFRGCSGQLELTSGGACDVAEVCWYPAYMVTKDFKAGWNTVTFNFTKSASYNSVDDQVFNKSAINYFRLYIVNLQSDDSNFVVKFDNMRFTSSMGNK